MPLTLQDQRLLYGIVALNLLLKLTISTDGPLVNDEPFTVYWSQQPLDAFWKMLRTENNPPLYFLLIKGWSSFTPFTEAWLRVPSAIGSAFIAWPLFRIGHALADRWVGAAAALLFTFTTHHHAFAHEVRAYSLLALLTASGIWWLVRAHSNDRHCSAWMMLAVIDVLLVYTHFFGWLAIGLQVLVAAIALRSRPLVRQALIAGTIAVLGVLPYAWTFLTRVGQSVSEGTWLTTPGWEEPYNMLWRWSNAPVLVVSFLLLLVLALLRKGWSETLVRLALVWSMAPLVGLFVLSQWVPLFLDRYLNFAAPGFALLVAGTLHHLLSPRRWRPYVLVLPVLAMATTFDPMRNDDRDPQAVVAKVNSWCAENCALQIEPRWYWLNYRTAEDIASLQNASAANAPDTIADGAGLHIPGGGKPATWVVVDAGSHLDDPGRPWYATLREEYSAVDSVRVDRFVQVLRFHD